MEKQLKMYYNYFYNNIALLGYGSLYASDGVSSVLWCPTAIAQTRKEWSADTLTAEALKEACIPYSFGLRVTPMAAGAQKEKEVRQIQVALTQATAQLLYSPQPSRSPLYPLLGEDTVSHASLCQTVLSLVSGDYEGALAAAMKARTVVEVDLESVRRQIHRVRVALGIDAIVLPLDGASAARTGIDFFCRCTRQEILNSLITAPQAVIEDLRKAHEAVAAGTAQEEGLVCASCKKRHIIRTEDFAKLDEVRKAATAEESNPKEKES
ncbi:hypothetical protein AGDE_09601 [Angomonas deanei]|uniref:Uncharacterized protein n=1 Tax=Angomonas deanei TaxID=59799 RepID=A0A7G2CGY7_9TRYP|nr:hypothetical protein AGDE_09601 [Angomonas deanei]CAD2218144.1 hypothetical protein, conserved [Angomonas deanei]|eukprot:EPY30123.1 hypothetical protein AGDE_09601 [Angomonas deanei]